MKRTSLLLTLLFAAFPLLAQAPSNLVVENIPAFPDTLAENVRPYLEFRTASLSDWNPARREALILTRFGDVTQLHYVKAPGGARTQLTFFPDRVSSGRFRPGNPNQIVFSKDIGGGEFFQLYRYDVPTGKVTLLTDGKSRNVDATHSNNGKWLSFSSTRRNGKDTDIWVMDVDDPASAKMVLQVEGGGWGVSDWSPDDKQALVTEYISAEESHVYLLDLASGQKKLITPKTGTKVAYAGAAFAADGRSIITTSDAGSEFQQLVRMDLAGKVQQTLTASIPWDVETYDLTLDRSRIAFVTNEDGYGILHVIDAASGREVALPSLPRGQVGSVRWHPNGNELGFTLSSSKSPSDVYSIDLATAKLERWTWSETGGLNPESNVDPELVKMQSFDKTPISAFAYRPDATKHAGKRPVLLNIHGGPEGQSRPVFMGRNNFLINDMGIAIVYPNVRGSTGYGKTFLSMDNGYKREDSVRDIGRIIEWIKADPRLDGDRIVVYGGSYGGYMTLATMTHYNDLMRAAIDVVGISNFVTFLNNTQSYRRDLRRVEYGDERDAKMSEFLQKISPLTNASKITKPLFVIQGFNDPRVPYTEAEQIVKAVRANNAPVWYLMAKDEGHGFAKKQNADFQFLSMVMFLREYALK